MKDRFSSFILPALFVIAWIYALGSSDAPGGVAGEAKAVSDLRWLLYFGGYVFVVSALMHSVLAKSTAKSIGWHTNGFQYELSFVSLGLGLGCFYAVYHDVQALTAISIPIIAFLGLASLNHVREIFAKKNFAPNNTFILIWDFGMAISLGALLMAIN